MPLLNLDDHQIYLIMEWWLSLEPEDYEDNREDSEAFYGIGVELTKIAMSKGFIDIYSACKDYERNKN